jgi:hypothetical protein
LPFNLANSLLVTEDGDDDEDNCCCCCENRTLAIVFGLPPW